MLVVEFAIRNITCGCGCEAMRRDAIAIPRPIPELEPVMSAIRSFSRPAPEFACACDWAMLIHLTRAVLWLAREPATRGQDARSTGRN
jgi:hypothetical protein